jgi:excisionase family DNA binding protein
MRNNNDMRGALKLREAAAYLGLSETTLLRLIKRGFIAPIRVTRHLLFSIRELDRFLNNPEHTTRFLQLAPQNTPEGSPFAAKRQSNLQVVIQLDKEVCRPGGQLIKFWAKSFRADGTPHEL